MIGYHYTSWENYQNISKIGLLPTPLDAAKLLSLIAVGTYPDWNDNAIWVWIQRLSGLSHVGSLLYQASTKASSKIVELEIDYSALDELCCDDGRKILLKHAGTIGRLAYHDYSEKAALITNAVPPDNIRLLGVYDLVDLLDNGVRPRCGLGVRCL